ncbi:hypothetical protein GE09DRAFT_1232440 [Coniochaeta sp. 2T2.1]|nr:hypothetical protein GE09DRAFT_1232440 [Coniochaeta sp. 2T2.1]
MGSIHSPLSTPFDYIIIGGGTAGLVVASRLTEDPSVRVLVVEAGADRAADPLVNTPGLVGAMYGRGEYDWNFSSVPQPTLQNRLINQARGKMLGGSSAMNFMMLLYPTRGILDAWGRLFPSSSAPPTTTWTYSSLSPYLAKFATVHPPPPTTRDLVGLTYHDETLVPANNNNGPVQVSFSEGLGEPNRTWMETFRGLGLEGRSYAGSGYYGARERGRENLVVVTETRVGRILFDTTQGEQPVARGVEVIGKDGQKSEVTATAEVILAAGALQSPQLLELSGIGGRAQLESLGIPVLVDNPNVGEGMQDHPIVCQSFEVADGVPSADVLRDPEVVATLVGMYPDGPMGQSTISVAYAPLVDYDGPLSADAKAALFASHADTTTTPAARAVRDVILSPDEPAFQYLLFPSQITIPDRPASMASYITPTQPENYITVMTILNHPFSRGSVHVASPDVTDLPVWDPAYNSHPLDLELLARGVRFVERIVDPSTPFGGGVLKKGGRRIPDIFSEPGDEGLERAREVVRQRQISVFHVSGSCAMLPRGEGGVVDEELRVYGVRGLRVVDASVFPLEPSGNIQSVVYAVAERAADLIKGARRGAS